MVTDVTSVFMPNGLVWYWYWLRFTPQKMGTAWLHSDIWIEVLFYLDIWIRTYKMYAFLDEKSSINSKNVFLLNMISGQLRTFLYHFRRYLAF